MAEMTRSTNTAEIDNALVIKRILAQARSNFYYVQFGAEDEYRLREGNTIKWFTRSALSAQTSALSDIPTRRKSTISHTPITANLALYGDDASIAEALDITSIVDIPTGIKDEIAEGAGLSIDTIVRDTLLAATGTSGITHLFANGKTSANITTADVATLSDFQDIATVMKNAKVPMIKHPKTGRMVYVAIITAKQENALMKDTTFKQMSQFGRQDAYFYGEIGTINDICFVVSTNVTTYTYNSVACEKALVLGKDAYGVAATPRTNGSAGAVSAPSVYFEDNAQWTMDKVNKMFSIVITKPGDGNGGGSHSDPYAVETIIAWKAYFAHKILQASFMRVYVTSSVLASSFA